MSKQDRQGVRTPADLEMKYNFGKSFAEVMGIANDARNAADKALGAVDNFDNELDSEEIFNRLTENGALQGLYREDGQLYINASYIKSGSITSEYVKTFSAANYTQDDVTAVRNIITGQATATTEQMKKYDLDEDGKITNTDFTWITRMVATGIDTTVAWKFKVDPSDFDEAVKLWREVTMANVSGVAQTTELVMLCVGREIGAMPATTKGNSVGSYWHTADGEMEWINPPMMLEMEYRTIERYDGKPVYAKLMSFGNLPNNTYQNVPHGGPTDNQIIYLQGQLSNGVPFSTGYNWDRKGGCKFWVDATNWYIRILTEGDMSTLTAKILIKYIKL